MTDREVDFRSCASCFFWDGDPAHQRLGRCRRDPPERDPDNGHALWVWTDTTDWCGEWHDRSEREDEDE